MTLLGWAALFAIGSVALIVAGVTVVRTGDEIATRTGLGRLLAGMLLIAAATSLPEIVTDVSAAATGAPDIAVGDLFGSSMANMAILAVIDLLHRRHVWRGVQLGQARMASIAIALTAIAVLGAATPVGFAIGWVGADTVLIAGAYAASVAWIRRARAPVRTPAGPLDVAATYPQPVAPELRDGSAPLAAVVRRFVIAAAVILIAGPVVARSATGIADVAGLGQTFVGVTMVALATSLPELVTSIGAVRIGAYDMAVGNLFGSNAINMAVLLLVDLAATGGPVLTGTDPAQIVAGVGAIGLMAVASAAIIHGEETRIARLEPDAVLLLLGYAGAIAAVWAA